MGVNEQTPLWLDCDTGHDDALAILLAGHSPEVRLLGISTVFGNASLKHTTYNTRAILQAIDRTDVPVYEGAQKPLLRDPLHAPAIHGESGLDGTTCLPEPIVPVMKDMSAIDAMYVSLSSEPVGTPWLVATGSLTNVATLFKRHPDLASHLGGLSIMGGAVGGNFTSAPMGRVLGKGLRFGNHTATAEFNIYCDPEAAQSVFGNPVLAVKTVLVPLDLSHQFLATRAVQMGLLFGIGTPAHREPTSAAASPIRRLYFEILTFFAGSYAEVFGMTEGPPVHDPLAVAAAVRPDLFHCNVAGRKGPYEEERFQVSVVTEGEHGSSSDILNGPSQCGRTLIQPLPYGLPGTKVPRGCETQVLWGMIEACLRAVEERMQPRSHRHHASTKA
ncbi:hypothetical protein BAUCODRAFT_118325 [Baudoinia panamericana UAMH 10762]|uniref:Inosine/uridine-preferring nucleoside hydrolase domain-containing protein n=1 Tax=Baudoinia panamericana (strain UAMH 10762) TaxID=717646 RepID=M2NMY9_BAUPA|nr:uncharacterized protein BAUCODRAFT_118325 [Baudoinia panamericana UAMH 10762]EMD00571.1 hypothetical protein BAUCODRAFT_118325 [Baudoinia panamericana UAMH 10762]